MPRRNFYSRRRFLSVAGATGFLVAASGRGGYAVAQTPVASAVVGDYKQAPMLDDQDLPPVGERVPEVPLVVEPVEQVGAYGGTWRSALVGGADFAWLDRTVGYENLVRWDPAWQEILPNVAESFEGSDDAKEFTFTLRKGHKWSDGEPFTSEDMRFYVEDVLHNTQLTASPGSNPPSIEVTDEQTFTIRFEKPEGLFLQSLAAVGGNAWTLHPSHYLKQFHEDYAEDIDQLIADEGVADWVELYQLKGSTPAGTPGHAVWTNPDFPRVMGWKLVEPYTGSATQMTFERNPYYFKVDPEGNQLPYIDTVRYSIIQDAEVMLLNTSAGEIDFHARNINTNTNKPVLAENRERGEYDFFDMIPSSMNTCVISLNQTHKDEAMREIFANKDFRVGLSYAINRQEIIDVVFIGQGEPWHLAPRQETPYFRESLAKAHIEFNVDTANEYLDKVLPDRDGDGMRVRPDGEAFSFVIEVSGDQDPAVVDAANLVQQQWSEVGVNCQISPVDRSLLYTRKSANEHDAVVWKGDGGLNDAMQEARYYIPVSDESNYGVAWAVWYNEAANVEAEPIEPPERVKEALALYDEIKATGDPQAQYDLFAQILEIAEEQFYAIGVSLPAMGYGIKKNNFKNVPAEMFDAYLWPSPGPTNPEQYYLEQ